jgi:hypothetical protein
MGNLLCRVGDGRLDATAGAVRVVVATAGDIFRRPPVFVMRRVLRVRAGGLQVRGRSVSAPGSTDRGTEYSREHKGGRNREYKAPVESHFPRPR